MEQAAGTIKIRKHPTPITWNGACRNGLDLNQVCLSNFSIMTGNANIPGAAMDILEATTFSRILKSYVTSSVTKYLCNAFFGT